MIAPARQAAFRALLEIAEDRWDLDAALDRARSPLTDDRDQALLNEIVLGTLRWQARLDWTLAPLTRTPLGRLDLEVRTALRMAAFQLLFLDRVPASAIVNDAVDMVRVARKSSAAGLVNAVLRRLASGERRPWPDTEATAAEPDVAALAVVTSHPAWLLERWLARVPRPLVDRWLAFDNEPAPAVLRVNPLSGASRDDVRAALDADGVVTRPCRWAPAGLVVEAGVAVRAAAVRDGRCHVQDEGSQLAALIAPVEDGHRVLDVCAAPGGKSLAYAAAAGVRGTLVACDVRSARVGLLAETLARGRASRAHVLHIDPTAALPVAPVFDVVAVDAPCSGLGTLRRNPDIRWRRGPDQLIQWQASQLELLRRASVAVAPGGALVYTTCSLEPEEDEDVVARFLADHTAFARASAIAGPSGASLAPFETAAGDIALSPTHGLEGYYGAVLRRRA